jgi:hypothetical protein
VPTVWWPQARTIPMINPACSIVGDLQQIASAACFFQPARHEYAAGVSMMGETGAATRRFPQSGKKEVNVMKLSLRSKVMFLVLTLVLSTAAFAGNDNHKGTMSLGAAAQVAGKQLPAGDYEVKWDGTGPATQLNIVRNGRVVATVPARVVKLDQKADRDSVEVQNANGDRTVTTIQFGGKAYALQIGGEAAGGDTASGNSVK